jgi:hypothetical protein
MTDDFERQLHAALRPVEAPADLAERILRALPDERRVVVALAPVAAVSRRKIAPRAPTPQRRYWMPGALAASLVAAVLLGQNVANKHAAEERQAGLAASRELMEALRITSQKLDVAYHAVKRPAEAESEENRS